LLQQYNRITPILFLDALSFVVEYETATQISALTSPYNIHSFQLEQSIFLFFISQNFILIICYLQYVGVIQVPQKDGYQTFCFVYGKLVMCFEVLTEREKKKKEWISAWQILSDSAEALANISLPVFLFYFPFRWKLENTFLFSTDHTHFLCTHSLYNQKEFFYVKIFKTLLTAM
jgi:hypothetical protein